MPAATAAPARHRASTAREGLRCRVRLADGRVFTGPLAPERHRALQLGILHEQTGGLVEIAAGARRDGRLQITTRRRADHFLPGGQAGEADWLQALLALAARHADAGEEVFLAPAVRSAARGDKHAVSETRFLWVDVDRPDGLPALWTFLAERPCHLLVESSAGHAHAYWKLDRPLPATIVIESTGELVEPIERAHLRLIHHLGTDADGKPNVADPACAERSRVMRLLSVGQASASMFRLLVRLRTRPEGVSTVATRERSVESEAALRYASVLFESAPVERWSRCAFVSPSGMGQRFHSVSLLDRSRRVDRGAVGAHGRVCRCASAASPGRRPGDVIERAGVVWADCDTGESVGALRAFRPLPAMVVASSDAEPSCVLVLDRAGQPRCDRADEPPDRAGARRRRYRCSDPARILRPAGSVNRKRAEPVAVRLLHLVPGERVSVADLDRVLPPEPAPREPRHRPAAAPADRAC